MKTRIKIVELANDTTRYHPQKKSWFFWMGTSRGGFPSLEEAQAFVRKSWAEDEDKREVDISYVYKGPISSSRYRIKVVELGNGAFKYYPQGKSWFLWEVISFGQRWYSTLDLAQESLDQSEDYDKSKEVVRVRYAESTPVKRIRGSGC